MSWYNNDNAFPSENKKYTRRFWMPNNTEKQITFVDGAVVECGGVQVKAPFKIEEYQIQLNNNWKNWFTRPINPEDDVLKQMGHRASKVAIFTVIDHSEWTDKKGNVHRDELSLYVVKRSSQTWGLIERQLSRNNGNLRGMKFNVSRMGDKSPGVGSFLEFEGRSEISEDLQPFNYLEILKPKTKQDMDSILNPVQTDTFSQDNDNWSSSSDPAQAGGGWGNTGGSTIPF